jgi:hypothetical protein
MTSKEEALLAVQTLRNVIVAATLLVTGIGQARAVQVFLIHISECLIGSLPLLQTDCYSDTATFDNTVSIYASPGAFEDDPFGNDRVIHGSGGLLLNSRPNQ